MKKIYEVLNVQNRKIKEWFIVKYGEYIKDIRKKGEELPEYERSELYKKAAKGIYDNKPIYNVLWRHAIDEFINTGVLTIPQSDAYCIMPNSNDLYIKIGKYTKLKDIELIWRDVESFQVRISDRPILIDFNSTAFSIYQEKIQNPKKTYEQIIAEKKLINFTSTHAKNLKSSVEKVLKLL